MQLITQHLANALHLQQQSDQLNYISTKNDTQELC